MSFLMSTFAPVDEQLTYLKKGSAEIIREADLRAKLEKSRATGKPLRVKLGMDPTAPDLHLGHTVVLAQAEAFSGSRAHRHLSDWRFYRDDRRSDRALSDAASADAASRLNRMRRPIRRRSSRFSIRQKTVIDFNRRWMGAVHLRTISCG